MVAGFNGVRPGVRRVHPGSLGSQECALCVVGFSRGRSAHLGASWGLSGSSGVAGYAGVRSRERRVHPGSLGSLELALGDVAFIQGRWVQLGTPWY